MPVTFQIFPRRGLVLITYTGRAMLDETAEAFAAFAKHPDAAQGQKHLIDLTGVTEVENDFPRLMALQARKAGELGLPILPSMLVYLAPTPVSQRMANMIAKSGEGIPGPAVAVIADEAEALSLVGCREREIEGLRRRVIIDDDEADTF